MSLDPIDKFSNNHYALANLALALKNTSNNASDITPEELAQFSEGSLTDERRDVVIEALVSNPALYQQWLDIGELQSIGQAQVTQPGVSQTSKHQHKHSPTLINRIQDWFANISYGPLAGATAFGLVAGLTIGIMPTQDKDEGSQKMVLQPAQQAEMKASLKSVEFQQVSPSFLPAHSFTCSSVSSLSLCASKTWGKQHWFMKDNGNIQALNDVLAVDQVTDLAVSGDLNYLAVVTQSNEKASLFVLDLNLFLESNLSVKYGVASKDQSTFSNLHWTNGQLIFNQGNETNLHWP